MGPPLKPCWGAAPDITGGLRSFDHGSSRFYYLLICPINKKT